MSSRVVPRLITGVAATLALACGATALADDLPAPAIKVIFVIAMENHDARDIYGNTANAPYINNVLMPKYARATKFVDELPPSIPSEPHYVWMEAGTNKFPDHTFANDNDPSVTNGTASKDHLVTQIRKAGTGIDWMSYQEGINANTGACPVRSSGFYAAKHNPFIFFKDVAGKTPSQTHAYCAAHHQDYSALAADLAAGTVASYNFITPNQCHDMHGQSGCADSNTIRAGDNWLKDNLPPLIDYANAHDGVIYITWDEPESTTLSPFLAIGPHVRAGYAGAVQYNHSSLLKSIERSLQLKVLATVKGADDLADLFVPGYFP